MYQYDAKAGTVTALYGSDEEIRVILEVLQGKCITTNIIESVFSACGAMVGFRGRRTLEGWIACLSAHFVIKGYPEALTEILDSLSLTAYIGNKMLSTSNVLIESQITRGVVNA